jgi:hypothetical protein
MTKEFILNRRHEPQKGILVDLQRFIMFRTLGPFFGILVVRIILQAVPTRNSMVFPYLSHPERAEETSLHREETCTDAGTLRR